MLSLRKSSLFIVVFVSLSVFLPSTFASVNSPSQNAQKWLSSDTNVISWTQASSYVGQQMTVDGTIVSTYVSSKDNTFLDFNIPYQGYFYAVIFSNDLGNFNFSQASYYLNKEVRVASKLN